MHIYAQLSSIHSVPHVSPDNIIIIIVRGWLLRFSHRHMIQLPLIKVEVQSHTKFNHTVISVKRLDMVVSSSHLIIPQVGSRSDNYKGEQEWETTGYKLT